MLVHIVCFALSAYIFVHFIRMCYHSCLKSYEVLGQFEGWDYTINFTGEMEKEESLRDRDTSKN